MNRYLWMTVILGPLLLAGCGEGPSLKSASDVEETKAEPEEDPFAGFEVVGHNPDAGEPKQEDIPTPVEEPEPEKPTVVVSPPSSTRKTPGSFQTGDFSQPQPQPQTQEPGPQPDPDTSAILAEQRAKEAYLRRQQQIADQKRQAQEMEQRKQQAQQDARERAAEENRRKLASMTDAERTIYQREKGAFTGVAKTRETFYSSSCSRSYPVHRYRGQYFAETCSGTVWLKKRSGRFYPSSNPFR